MNWLGALNSLTAHRPAAVLVTVAAVEGSGPREPGTKMVVTAGAQFDTIGGGHLELRACEIARAMLTQPAVPNKLERFPLGPSLGQCCGGVVYLAFELIAPHAYCYFDRLGQYWRARRDTWRLIPLTHSTPAMLVDADGDCVAGPEHAVLCEIDRTRGCHIHTGADGMRWLVDPCLAYRAHLTLFGAGHVGEAIVQALANLPCHVTWVDSRDDIFPPIVPANVTLELTDTPEALVDDAPAGGSFLVMTHSHALDQQLSEAILRRADMGWFGLIGSKTKRMQFEHRLRDRGIAAARLADMVCPIGVPGITGKAPAVIAVSVCAQLLMVWEEAERQALQAPAIALTTN